MASSATTSFRDLLAAYDAATTTPEGGGPPQPGVVRSPGGILSDPIEERTRASSEAIRGIIPGLVHATLGMLNDIKNVVGNAPRVAAASARDLPSLLLTGQSPHMEALIQQMGPEQVKSTIRGNALAVASAFGGAAGNATKALGEELVRQAGVGEVSPLLANALIRTTSGAAAGAAFAATYGPQHQLAEDGLIHSNALIGEIVGLGLFGAATGLVGSVWAAGADVVRGAPEAKFTADAARGIREGLRESVAERTDLVLRKQLPVAESARVPEEVVAQVVSGTTEQGVTRSGLMANMNDFGRGVLDLVQTRFPAAKRIDPSTWGLGLRLADSRTYGMWFSQRAAEFVEGGMSARESDIFWKSLVESRFAQIRRDLTEQAAILKPGERVNINGKMYSAEGVAELARNVPGPALSPEERTLLEISPAISEAQSKYGELVLPLLTQIRTRNGLRSLVKTDRPFIPLVPATPEMIAEGVRHVVPTRSGSEWVVGQATARTTPGARRALGQANAYVTDGRMIFGRVMGREAAIDRQNELIANIIDAPWSERLAPGAPIPKTVTVGGVEYPAARIRIVGEPEVLKNRFGLDVGSLEGEAFESIAREEAKRLGVPKTQAIGAGSDLVERRAIMTGEEFVLSTERLADTPLPGEIGETVLGEYVVPRPIAEMYEELTLAGQRRNLRLTARDFENPVFQAYSRMMDFNTALLLASPVEFSVHSLRMTSRLASLPSLLGSEAGVGRRIVDKWVPWFGPRASALKEIFSVYGSQEDFMMEALLSEIPGALPSRAFSGEFAGGVHALTRRLGVPQVGETIELGRKALFNLPTQRPIKAADIISGKTPISGLGLDIRTRIVAAKALKRWSSAELKREPTRAEYAEFLQQWGNYTEELQSNLQSFLRANRLNPFAANLSVLAAEIRGFLGGTNLPRTMVEDITGAALYRYKAEVLLRLTLPTAFVAWAAQKALVGTDIWNNEQGFKDDIQVGYDAEGRGIYVPLRSVEPDFNRAFRILGARALLETVGNQIKTPVADALQELANTAITSTVGSPGIQAAFTLAAGSAPFITGEGEILRVVPPDPTDLLAMKHRFLEAAGTSNPTFEAIFNLGESENLPEGPAGNIIQLLNATTGGVRVGKDRLLAASGDLRADEATKNEIVFDRVVRALERGDPPGERFAFYREEAETFPTRRLQLQALIEMRQLDTRLRAGAWRKYVEARVRR